jgi:hypothetical protein
VVKKGLAGVLIAPLIIIIIGIVVVLYILKNKNLFRFGSVMAGATVGETTVQGPNIYPVVGDIPRSGAFGISVANSGTSFRDNVSFPCDKCARETIWFVIPGNQGEGGMDFSVKMGSHGDGGNDNGSLIAFSQVPLGGSEQECHEGYYNGEDNVCSPIWCQGRLS